MGADFESLCLAFIQKDRQEQRGQDWDCAGGKGGEQRTGPRGAIRLCATGALSAGLSRQRTGPIFPEGPRGPSASPQPLSCACLSRPGGSGLKGGIMVGGGCHAGVEGLRYWDPILGRPSWGWEGSEVQGPYQDREPFQVTTPCPR